MANPSHGVNPQTTLAYTRELFDLLLHLDKIDKEFESNQVEPGKLEQKVFETFSKKMKDINGELKNYKHVIESNQLPIAPLLPAHLERKITHLQEKYTLYTGASNVAAVPATVFQNNTPQIAVVQTNVPQIPHTNPSAPRPSLSNRNISFMISATPAPIGVAQKVSCISVTLNRISFLLKNGNEHQALEELKTLPEHVKQSVFCALWLVRGQPTGDGDFGGRSFFNQPTDPLTFGQYPCFKKDESGYSTPQQKACAVELVKTRNSIDEMVSLFKEQKHEEAIAIFLTLPTQVQSSICTKLGQEDFIKIPFFQGTEERHAFCAKRAETLTSYCLEFVNVSETVQTWIRSEMGKWTEIDYSKQLNGPQKNEAKKASIHEFSAKIIGAFLGINAKIDIPAPQATGFKTLALAYIENYPFLKPFLFQLENTLTFPNEILQDLPNTAQNGMKSSEKKGVMSAMKSDSERRQYRVNIMNETFDTLQKRHYINSQGKTVTLDLYPSVQSLALFRKAEWQAAPVLYDTQIYLHNKDCLTVAQDCAERGRNPMMMIAASNNHFGGHYKEGAGAQEENGCRRSGLSLAVDSQLGKQENNFYPLNQHGDEAGLYVAHVPVFRGEEKDGYPYLDQPFETAMGIVSAYNFSPEHQSKAQTPVEIRDGKIPEAYIQGTRGKIHTFLQMAVQNGHDSIVLIPFGCGAFCTPPEHMCDLIMQEIVQNFPHSFKEIHFAIIDDHNARKAHNPEGNYTPFKRMIGYFANPLKAANITFKENL